MTVRLALVPIQPPIQWVPHGPFPWGKLWGVWLLSPSNVEIVVGVCLCVFKYTSTSPRTYMACILNLPFTLRCSLQAETKYRLMCLKQFSGAYGN
jgi:hypothetical protein